MTTVEAVFAPPCHTWARQTEGSEIITMRKTKSLGLSEENLLERGVREIRV